MKSRLLFTASLLTFLALLAMPVGLAAQEPKPKPARYAVTDLGTLGGTYSYAYGLNNAGVVAGGAATQSQTGGLFQTAFLWYRGHIVDLGTLGGPDCPDCNSEAGGPNANGESPILSEIAETDPNGEDVCAFGTHRQCLAAVWKDGSLRALPTLPGGNNANPFWINNRGQVIGFSENGTLDSTCIAATPFQVQRFEAVIWGPNGEIRKLRPLEGDVVAFGFGINDKGQAVGSSGLCSNTALPPFAAGPQAAHAVLWEKDGSPHDLGGLVSGGTINIPGGINDRGEVAGGSQSSGGAPHAFLWTRDTGIRDLGTLPGDFLSAAPCCNTINNKGQVVGFSLPGPLGSGRAFLWQDGVMTDLNALIPKGSPWYLLDALSINDDGQIAGYGTIGGNIHAFLATPCDGNQTDTECGENMEGALTTGEMSIEGSRAVLPENASELLQQRLRFRPHEARPVEPQ
jgi:probable HAF family extracellular repeat protein